MYHRKSVSKLILLLSPIKCHFALQCFSSSVILKRISIGTATIATVKTTAAATPSPNCHNVLCRDGNGRNHSQLLCVCVCVVFFCKYFVAWVGRREEKTTTQPSLNSIVRFARGEVAIEVGDWLVCWCVNEYMYTLLYLCSERIFGWCYDVCCWLIFSSTIKDQTIYQSELVSIYKPTHIYLSARWYKCNGCCAPFSPYDFVQCASWCFYWNIALPVYAYKYVSMFLCCVLG